MEINMAASARVIEELETMENSDIGIRASSPKREAE